MTWTLLKKLYRDLKSRVGSIAALLLIVTIGISVLFSMLAVYRDLDDARRVYYDEYRLADFVLSLERLPPWVVEQCKQLPNVKDIEGRVTANVLVDLPTLNEPLAGVAHSFSSLRQLDGVLLRQGSYLSPGPCHEVIVNDQFAKEHGLEPGDSLAVTLYESRYELLIVGTARSPAYVMVIPPGGGIAPDPGRYAVLYMSPDFLAKACKLEGAYNEIVGTTWQRDELAIKETLARLAEKLDAFGVTLTTPLQQRMSFRFVEDELQGLRISATYLPFCFLLVAAMVMRVLMGRLVSQQRTVIGTLKALGHSVRSIRFHFLFYGLAIGLMGGTTGVGLGLLFQRAMADLYATYYTIPKIVPHLYWDLVLLAFAISVAVAIAGTVSAVQKAVKLEPAEAMRPPKPEQGAHIFLENLPFIWSRLSFMSKMVARSILRNPFRASVSVAAAAVAMSLMVSTICMVDSLDYIINFTFAKVAHQDVTVTFRRPRDERALNEMARLPGISRVEAQLDVVCDLIGPTGSRKRTAVTGLPSTVRRLEKFGQSSHSLTHSSRLFTPLNGNEEPIIIPDKGLVLTRKLASILKARAGDTVALRPLIGRRDKTLATVVAVVDSYLGLGAYCSISYASRLLGEEWVAQTALGQEFKGAGGSRYLRSLKKRPAITGLGKRARSLHQIEETMGAVMGTMLTLLVLFAGAIAFGSVLNTALVSLSERQREIGTLRVIGYSPHEIAQLFSRESFLLNALGIIIGIAGGIGLTHLNAALYDTEMYRFPVIIGPSVLIISASLMVIFVGCAQLVVYGLIVRLPWLEVLKVKE